MKKYLKFIIVFCTITLAACSSDSSSGGGQDATSCVSASLDGVTNNCSYDINIDAGAGVELIGAGETIRPSGSSLFIAACRAPLQPNDAGEESFTCQ